MISTGQILAAAAVTAIAVAVAAAAVRWSPAAVAASALSSFVLIVVWRAISNLAGLNGDFLPAVSAGDTGCLLAGALGPAVVARLPWFSTGTRHLPAVAQAEPGAIVAGRGGSAALWSNWGPALAGAVVGFLVNVVIL